MNDKKNIYDFGWNEYWEKEWNRFERGNAFPGRVVADFGQKLKVISAYGELSLFRPIQRGAIQGEPIQKCPHQLQIAAGDWLAIVQREIDNEFEIKSVIERKTKFSRAAPGTELNEQIVAANIDIVLIVQSLNKDFNMRRLERYMIATWDSGAEPVVLLTKADLCEDIPSKIATVQDTIPGAEVIIASALTGEGLENIKKYLQAGRTVALLGSSGTGKSTLINRLVGKEILSTQEIREDDSKGRHTTAHRELILLPDGGLIMDTPGMRMLSVWDAEAGIEILFGDIEEMVKSCRYSDCQHKDEPGCEVREAIESGMLEITRWESWLKLQKEMRHLEAKKQGKQRLLEKQWGRQIAKFKKDISGGRK